MEPSCSRREARSRQITGLARWNAKDGSDLHRPGHITYPRGFMDYKLNPRVDLGFVFMSMRAFCTHAVFIFYEYTTETAPGSTPAPSLGIFFLYILVYTVRAGFFQRVRYRWAEHGAGRPQRRSSPRSSRLDCTRRSPIRCRSSAGTSTYLAAIGLQEDTNCCFRY
jgi:hypothetical protein